MSEARLKLYSASAGSGKTHELTGNYIALLLGEGVVEGGNFRNILSVTFTNKAAAEMKERILRELNLIAIGGESPFFPRLLPSNLNEVEKEKYIALLRKRAAKILADLLQDYSRFSVGTIDSFFQKVLRMFTREIGINPGYNLELDDRAVLQTVVDDTIASVDENEDLLKWLSEFAGELVSGGDSWNLEREIYKLAYEIFNERFKLLGSDIIETYGNRENIRKFGSRLKKERDTFASALAESSNEILIYAHSNGITVDMVYYKNQGFLTLARSFASGEIVIPNTRVRAGVDDPEKLFGSAAGNISNNQVVKENLHRLLVRTIGIYDEGIVACNTANAILSNLYTLGILHDLGTKLKEINSDENRFLLSDTGYLLRGLIGKDQTPFIYEKVGTHYNHILIDEFQDTSQIQYENFRPLIDNAISQGNRCLVVGDIKQSIYRWRNSDWKILAHNVKYDFGKSRIDPVTLPDNHRSCSNIVAFNNSLFSILPGILDAEFETAEGDDLAFRNLYASAVQNHREDRPDGLISFTFLEGTKSEWVAEAMDLLPQKVMELLRAGYLPSDIGIIVRSKSDGDKAVKALLNYQKMSAGKEGEVPFSVISDQSLLLYQSAAIIFITSLLEWLDSKDDELLLATILRNYAVATKKGENEAGNLPGCRHDLAADQLLPAGYNEFLSRITGKPLYEIVVSVIDFFSLGKEPENIPFLDSFLDLVLHFSSRNSSDTNAFLHYWDERKDKEALKISGAGNSIRVMTIHKSKGLDFTCVIIPVLDWDMDHGSKGPILWVEPVTEPFNTIPVLPVKYRSNLKETIFSKEYNAEKHASYVDNLNLLYVAMTRAREVLIGIGKRGKNDSLKDISGLVRKALATTPGPEITPSARLSDYYDEEGGVFTFGRLPEVRAPRKESPQNPLSAMKLTDPVSRLRLKYDSGKFLVEGSVRVERLNYGRLMHLVFSEIEDATDVSGAVDKLVLRGELLPVERDELIRRINRQLSQPEVIEWFDGTWKVLNEREILYNRGKIAIPDRIIMKDGKVIIVDFKFGEEQEKYKKQVAGYANLISEMGFTDISAFLWYVEQEKVVRIDLKV